MSSLLDSRALTGIAIQLLSARRRLSLRTGGELPTVGELAVGLRMYLRHCDEQRMRQPPRDDHVHAPCDSFGTPTAKRELRDMICMADLTYRSREVLLARATRENFQVLAARHDSERWAPAYYLAYLPASRTVLLAIRGSQETSDFLTNLSVETESFLDGVGHRGVVRSARNLLDLLRPKLLAFITSQRDVRRLVLTGHSLGGAVAAAMTLMLRTDAIAGATGTSAPVVEHPVFRDATCVSVGPPPFLSRRLAARTAQMGIVTLVTGLDCVPRLSAASLDRFLLRVAQFDWGKSLGATVGRAAGAFVSPESAERVERFVSDRGASTLSWAVSAFNTAAQGALDHRRRARTPSSGLIDGALSVGVMASSLIESQFFSAHASQRQPDYAFARHFGMSGDDVERVLGEEGPPDMFLAGEVVWFNIRIPSDEEMERPSGPPVRMGSMRKVARDELSDVEGSLWMIAHHKPSILIEQLNLMLVQE